MPKKSKLPTEEKVKLVKAYLTGKISVNHAQNVYGVSEQTIQRWIRLYKARGSAGLSPALFHCQYSPELKLQAVKDLLTGELTYRDICSKYDITSEKSLCQWIKCYNSHGYVNQPKRERVINMAKDRNTTLEERIEIVSYCISNNKDYSRTIEEYDISYRQIYGWVRRYEKDGPDGLTDHRGKRKEEASMTEVEKLRAELKLKEAENYRLQMENELLKKLEEIERGRIRDRD